MVIRHTFVEPAQWSIDGIDATLSVPALVKGYQQKPQTAGASSGNAEPTENVVSKCPPVDFDFEIDVFTR